MIVKNAKFLISLETLRAKFILGTHQMIFAARSLRKGGNTAGMNQKKMIQDFF